MQQGAPIKIFSALPAIAALPAQIGYQKRLGLKLCLVMQLQFILLLSVLGGCSFFRSPNQAPATIHDEPSSSLSLSEEYIDPVKHEAVAVVESVREYDHFPSQPTTAHSSPGSILVLWEKVEDDFDAIVLAYSHSENGPFTEVEIAPDQIEELEHPQHGSLAGFRLLDIESNKDLYVSIRVKFDGQLSEPGTLLKLPANQLELDVEQKSAP